PRGTLPPAPTHRAYPGAPPPGGHLDALLPEPGLCLSWLGGLGQSPRQWPSQWRSLAAAAVCRLSPLFSPCIPQIVIRVCVAMFAKTCHLATLSLIGGYLGQLWP